MPSILVTPNFWAQSKPLCSTTLSYTHLVLTLSNLVSSPIDFLQNMPRILHLQNSYCFHPAYSFLSILLQPPNSPFSRLLSITLRLVKLHCIIPFLASIHSLLFSFSSSDCPAQAHLSSTVVPWGGCACCSLCFGPSVPQYSRVFFFQVFAVTRSRIIQTGPELLIFLPLLQDLLCPTSSRLYQLTLLKTATLIRV